MLRRLLVKEELFQYERLRIFGEMWSALLNRPKWVAREQEILEQESGRRFSPEVRFGRLHLAFLQKDDEAVFEDMSRFPPEALPYTFQWLGELTAKKTGNG